MARGTPARLPFFVQDVRRFRAAPGATHSSRTSSATLTRKPTRSRGAPCSSRRVTAHSTENNAPTATPSPSTSTAGREETLEGSEVLAALTRQPHPTHLLVVARESEGGVRYVILNAPARFAGE